MPKILVVDDEPSILNLLTSYLKAEGYEVYTASDGLAALKAAKTYQPDIIILDLMLPGLDGLEVLSRLRRELDVYVILLTARTEETDKIVGLSVGADDYVTKPFSPRADGVCQSSSAPSASRYWFRSREGRTDLPPGDD